MYSMCNMHASMYAWTSNFCEMGENHKPLALSANQGVTESVAYWGEPYLVSGHILFFFFFFFFLFLFFFEIIISKKSQLSLIFFLMYLIICVYFFFFFFFFFFGVEQFREFYFPKSSHVLEFGY